MNAEIVVREDAQVLGITARIKPMEADYRELWDKQYGPHEDVVAALAAEKGCYGVYYGTDQEGVADFIAGMVVGDVGDVPEGLTLRELPGGQYAAFQCTLSTICNTWGNIYSQWLPASGYVEDESRPGIEHYPSDAMGTDAPVTIYVPVKEK